MDTISFKTISANKNTVDKKWVVVDADGQNLGRLASKVAILLRGKHKPNFTPHVDCGDNVIVINSKKIELFLYLRSKAFLVLIIVGVCILTKYIPDGKAEASQLTL